MENKPRKPWIAGLLSLIEPGLGHVYNGEIHKTLIIYLLPLLVIPLLVLCLDSRFVLYFLILFIVLCLTFYILVFVDAIRTAKRFSNIYTLKKYNKVIVYIGIYLFVAIIGFSIPAFIKHNVIQAFQLPSASMEPTLLVGDYILVDKRQEARSPQKGDLVVFEDAKDPSKSFIKRVVAVGGDTIEIRDKQLILNGKVIKEEYVIHKEAYIIPVGQSPRDQLSPRIVPLDCYFVMGDNRDQSHYDSRFGGYISKNEIKGTVKRIYWSWDRNTFSVRWARIGKIIS